jgi:hypothetical protein
LCHLRNAAGDRGAPRAARASESVRRIASTELKRRNGFSRAGALEGEFSDVTRGCAGKRIGRYQE